jgi:multicomponent Na+:H+ antiporter subunit D
MNLIVLPVILPLLFAVIMLFAWKYISLQRILNLVGSLILLIVSVLLFTTVLSDGVQSLHLGNWKAPFGIVFAADILSSVMVLISSIIAFTTALYSFSTIDNERESFGYYPLLNTLIMGINGAFLTGDVFNLYVWFEVMLISSFVLLVLGGTRNQLEGGIKYFTLNLISSAFFLAAVGLLYGLTGTLNMADLSEKIKLAGDNGLITVISIFFLISFGIKSAVFPLYFWLPSSYHTPPSPVSAIFAGLLTKVGVYSLIRMFTLVFTVNSEFLTNIILIVAVFTMVTGVFGAASQNEIRKILSFHIISQIGYMIMGLGLYSVLGIAGAVFYLIHHIIVKTNLFFIGGLIQKLQGTYELKKLGGLYKVYPIIGLLFLIPALSLAGIPPLSGFWAKFLIVKAGLELQEILVVVISLFVSLLTLFSMTKIWNEVFWKPAPKDNPEINFKQFTLSKKIMIFSPIIFLAILTVIIGFSVEEVFQIANQSAYELLNPVNYINKVLGRF